MNEDCLRSCPDCNIEGILNPRPDTPHNAEIRCPLCGNFLGWQKKEKNLSKRNKSKIKPEIDYCQLCLRNKDDFGVREVLEVHHIDEIQNGGIDEPGNIWFVCTHCHSLIHHVRTYLNYHIKDKYNCQS